MEPFISATCKEVPHSLESLQLFARKLSGNSQAFQWKLQSVSQQTSNVPQPACIRGSGASFSIGVMEKPSLHVWPSFRRYLGSFSTFVPSI